LWFFPLETNLVLLFVLICQIRPCFKFIPSWTRLQIKFEELILERERLYCLQSYWQVWKVF
jgi:hypothetical protein